MPQKEFGDMQRWGRQEFLFEGTNDMIFFFDRDGTVRECNRSAYEQLGFERDDTIYMQKIFRTCVKVEDWGLAFQDVILDTSFETTIYRKNETCFPICLRISLLQDDSENFGVCRASNAIQQTETKKRLVTAKEEVEEAHKERNEMVANVTHELRTPVNGVLGLAQTLLDTSLSQEQRETVELITYCCNNMTKIINNILDFSKLQSGKFTIEKREFSFHKMMNKIVKTNRPAIEEKGLRLVCNVSEDIPDKLIGDELRITQILNNLLSNATKFTSMGQIVVNVIRSLEFEDELELFFMVIDSGIGITDADKDKLFKSFSQVDASITRKFGGTGLGLSIVKDLVHMMGGDVNVESEKGKGSTFSFSVRVNKVEQQTEIQTTEAASEERDITNLSFHLGADVDEETNLSEIFHLGTEANMQEITSNMERLVLCIEMENWDRANNFAENIKQLVAEDPMNLKRKAFRLQMTLRKGDHGSAIAEYEVLKEAIAEMERAKE